MLYYPLIMEEKWTLKRCSVCPLKCGADRYKERGVCGASADIEVSAYNLHFGEEPPISGERGSGTIFFTHCPLGCSFCQNYPISSLGNGRSLSEEEFIRTILSLQEKGVHNINFVTPTHYALHILSALRKVKGRELKIPVVYNTSGYENIEILRELEDLVDIYLPDMKYSMDSSAESLSRALGYLKVNSEALREMYRQKGNLTMDNDGIATKGVLIRHLVLPEGVSGTQGVLKFIRKEFGKDAALSLMSQYHPAGEAVNHPQIGRRLNEKEYAVMLDEAERLGLDNVYIQEMDE